MDKKSQFGSFSSLLAEKISDGLNGKTSIQLYENVRNENIVLREKLNKLETLLNFYSTLHQQSPEFHKVEIVNSITKTEFYNNYYFKNRPIVIRNTLNEWPAFKKWCPKYFKDNYGTAEIQLTNNRNKLNYERDFQSSIATSTMSAFVDSIIENKDDNDFYIVARNYFFSNPAFRSLKQDILPPLDIVDFLFEREGGCKLWFGPKGTITPLHHDKHSILFTQVYGRKHFKLIPSFEITKVYNEDRYYSAVDAANVDAKKFPDFLQTSLTDIFLDPGDVLFIPAGWWHWVKSLDVSISVTFSNFYVENFNTKWNCV